RGGERPPRRPRPLGARSLDVVGFVGGAHQRPARRRAPAGARGRFFRPPRPRRRRPRRRAGHRRGARQRRRPRRERAADRVGRRALRAGARERGGRCEMMRRAVILSMALACACGGERETGDELAAEDTLRPLEPFVAAEPPLADAPADAAPLRRAYAHVSVEVDGLIARTTVTEVLVNDLESPAEASFR